MKFPDADPGTSGDGRREIHSDPFSFTWPVRVYWEDTDAGGVVYHARYLAFMERARSEWMRALGWGQEQLRTADDVAFAVRAMELDFRAPARLDTDGTRSNTRGPGGCPHVVPQVGGAGAGGPRWAVLG